jgi:hypothetical protein
MIAGSMGRPAAVPAHHDFATIKNIFAVVMVRISAVGANGQKRSEVL